MSKINGFLGRRNLIQLMSLAGVSAVTATACGQATQTSQAPAPAAPDAQTVAATTASAPEIVAAQKRPESDQMSPEQALNYLMDGNKRFLDNKTVHPRQNFARLTETGADQFPFASFLSCADSRVPVEILFDQGIGDCFVVRLAGNISTDQALGSLEFGSAVLGSRVIMVLGHEACGAVNAVLRAQKLPAESKIGSLVPFIEAGVEKAKGQSGNDLVNAIKDNVVVQVESLKKSPILTGLIKEKKLMIIGAYYDLDKGTVEILGDKAAKKT
jgi:carbonic anhydrase